MADTQRLAVDLSLKGDFNAGMGKAQKNLKGFTKQAGAATKQTSKLGGSLRSMGKQAKGSILSGVGLGAGLVGFQLLTGAVSKFVNVLGDSVRMAAEEEAEIAQLTRAIEANDDAWDGNIDAVERLINTRQQLAFSDGEQREGLRLLVSNTKDATKAQELLGTAMDFARLRGISLRTSADLLGRAFQGQFATLSRYGVVLGKGATATEALAAIQKMASGQAKAFADTTEGKLVRSQIALDDAMQDLGRTLTPLVGGLTSLAVVVIPAAVESAKALAGAVGEIKGGLAAVATQEVRASTETALLAREYGVTEEALLDRINAMRHMRKEAEQVVELEREMEAATLSSGFTLDESQRVYDEVQQMLKETGAATEDVTEATSEYEEAAKSLVSIQGRAANQMGAGLIPAIAGVDDGLGGVTRSTRIFTESTIDMTAAVAGSEKGFRKERRAIGDLIDRAEELGEKRDRTGGRLKRLTALEQDLQRKQAVAAEKGKDRQVAAYQAAIEKVREEKAELLSMQQLANKLRHAPPIIIDARIAGLGGLAAGLRVSGAGGAGGIKSFHSGTDFVPRTGLAVLQKGEAVIPAGQNQGGVLPPIYVTPRIEVAASQVELQTSRVVRTHRTRVNA